jgi:hypothetical protein
MSELGFFVINYKGRKKLKIVQKVEVGTSQTQYELATKAS